jgi:histidinol-phosphate aminotransferase
MAPQVWDTISGMRSPSKLIRPLVRGMHAYVPGEQPKIKGLIKLNTNENPYPPSPKVIAAVRAATDARLRLYPNPTSQPLREAIATFHRCRVEQVFVGNGSDECLALAVRAFVEPFDAAQGKARSIVQYFTPSYSLYPVLADAHGAIRNPVPLGADFSLPSVRELQHIRAWWPNAPLTFITTPNAPSGRGYRTPDLDAICGAHHRGVVVLDEAYVDFARANAMALVRRHPHVLIARTFSKAYALCFQRVGYFVGHPELVAALDTIRDSYNVNGLGQVAALAALRDQPYYRAVFKKIVRTRDWLSAELTRLGFDVLPSETNFILARPPKFPAKSWLQRLRDRRILVRWFDMPELRDRLRITIGTDQDARALVKAVKDIL